MTELAVDDIHGKLLSKISSQAIQLGHLNQNLFESVEYIKTCESKLREFENAAVTSLKKEETNEQSEVDNKGIISKLEEALQIKERRCAISDRKVADLSRDLQKMRIQLETAQHALRFATHSSAKIAPSNHSKIITGLKSEVIAWKASTNTCQDQLESSKTRDRELTSQISILEETLQNHCKNAGIPGITDLMIKLTNQGRMVKKLTLELARKKQEIGAASAALSGKPPSNFTNSSQIIDPESSNVHSTIDNDSLDADEDTLSSHEEKITALENIVVSLQQKLSTAEKELRKLHSNEITEQFRALEEERDTLLEYIRVDMVKSSDIRVELENTQMELLECRECMQGLEQRAKTVEDSYHSEFNRAGVLLTELSTIQRKLKNMEEQYQTENAEKNSEAKKGVCIISVLTSELKAARSKIGELEEMRTKLELSIRARHPVPSDMTLEGSNTFEQSRKNTQELLSLRKEKEEWIQKSELWGLNGSHPCELILIEMTRDLKAVKVEEERQKSPVIPSGGDHSRKALLGAASARVGVRANTNGRGYGNRYSQPGRRVDPGYMAPTGSSSSSGRSRSRSPPRMRAEPASLTRASGDVRLGVAGKDCLAVTSEPLPISTPQPCPMSAQHAVWTNLHSISKLSPSLHEKIKKMASDLLLAESKYAEIQDNFASFRIESDKAFTAKKDEMLGLLAAEKVRDREFLEVRIRLESTESELEKELGAGNILDQTIVALLAAPDGWERFLDPKFLSSLAVSHPFSESAHESFSSRSPNLNNASPTRGAVHSGSAAVSPPRLTPHSWGGRDRVADPDLKGGSRSPSPRKALPLFSASTYESLKHVHGRERSDKGSESAAGDVTRGSIPPHRVPEIVSKAVAVASAVLNRACDAEERLSSALSDLQTVRSALRISQGKYDFITSKMEDARQRSHTKNDSFLEMEKELKGDLEYAADLAEQQNALIIASDAKVQTLMREKHLVSAQLTAAHRKESLGVDQFQVLLREYILRAGLDPGSFPLADSSPPDITCLLECARKLFSKLLHSHISQGSSANMMSDNTELRGVGPGSSREWHRWTGAGMRSATPPGDESHDNSSGGDEQDDIFVGSSSFDGVMTDYSGLRSRQSLRQPPQSHSRSPSASISVSASQGSHPHPAVPNNSLSLTPSNRLSNRRTNTHAPHTPTPPPEREMSSTEFVRYLKARRKNNSGTGFVIFPQQEGVSTASSDDSMDEPPSPSPSP